jgi:hypothetical protein
MINDIQHYKHLLESAGSTPDLDTIATHFKNVRDSQYGITVDFKLPLDDKIDTEDGLHFEMSEFEIALRLNYRSGQGEGSVTPGTLLLWYEASDDNHLGSDDEDDIDDYRIAEWFSNGNYTATLENHLLKAGFSQDAVSEITMDAFYGDNIEYHAPKIEHELTMAVGNVLQDDFQKTMSKFGFPILATNVKFTTEDIKWYKPHLIKYLLQNYKEHGVNQKLVMILNNLFSAGVDWPELTVIKRSIDSEESPQ